MPWYYMDFSNVKRPVKLSTDTVDMVTPIKPDPGTPVMLRVNIGTGGVREDRRREVAPWLVASRSTKETP
jgi:hypothetical protein